MEHERNERAHIVLIYLCGEESATAQLQIHAADMWINITIYWKMVLATVIEHFVIADAEACVSVCVLPYLLYDHYISIQLHIFKTRVGLYLKLIGLD